MTINRILISITFVCLLAAAGLYTFAYSHDHYRAARSAATSTSSAKVPSASIADGTYTVQIRSILTTPEDTSITFRHVTYFEGAEASSSARHEVACPDKPLAACVPTLTRGFYVRESGAPEFTAPALPSVRVELKDTSHASVAALQNASRQFQPVFDIVILNGVLVSITEKSPL